LFFWIFFAALLSSIAASLYRMKARRPPIEIERPTESRGR
jgi:hypothetical protein